MSERYIDPKLGLVKIFNDDTIKEIEPVEIKLVDYTLKPNEVTTLNDFFNEPVTYLGLHDNYMQFKIGEELDLFENKIYTSEFLKLSEHRIMTIYQAGTARDYNFKNGVWK